MNAPASTDTIQTTAPLPLWRVAAAFMHILHALFGDPSQVATKHTLTLKAHQLLASWLRCGEAMMRRLLLIEAAVYAKPNTRPLLRTPRKRARKPVHFFAETPEEWRVNFCCLRGSPASRRPTPKRAGKPVQLRSAWPLAERYEALLRAFNNPLPYAHRLARKLHATPHRVRELLCVHAEAKQRIDRFEELTGTATTRAVIFNST